ncbi:MAG: hypothetical protein ACI35S_03160 [Anaeroplasma sp.]
MRKSKYFIFILLLISIFIVTGCDKNVCLNYIDHDTNEEVILEVKATEDKQEVAKVIYALNQIEIEKKDVNSVFISMNADISMDDKSTEYNYSIKSNTEFGIDFLNMDYYAKSDNDIVLAQSKDSNNAELDCDIYGNMENVYINLRNIKAKDTKIINEKYVFSLNSLIDLIQSYYPEFDFSEEKLVELKNKLNSFSFEKFIKDIKDNTDANIEDVCEALNISIISSKNDIINFSMDISIPNFDNEARLSIVLGYNVKTGLPELIEFDGVQLLNNIINNDERIINFYFKKLYLVIDVKTLVEIPTLKASEKEDYSKFPLF